ncbi:RHS repeat-associated core domain-containing protein [Paenibacillus fonticola]|uniref:RHS repeat-associated core domain-containing protein n=1 Tax=Paenibacillus fonticola TaxID=379896 RepID=UPI0003A770BF|nr:RHS repeat-associated core domain-containing protein [Paenibacillus fonticola]
MEGRIAYLDGYNEVANSQGHMTRYEYTPDYLCTRIVDPLGGEWQYSYSDAADLLSETDEEGRMTWYEYDEVGLLVQETQPDGGIWQYTYDEHERLLQATNPEGASQTWQYDEQGRVSRIVGADQSMTMLVYDESHRVCEVRNPQGAVTTLAYDDQDNLVETLPDGSSGKWSYNHRGECLEAVNPLGAKQHFVDVIFAEDKQHRVAFGYTPLGEMTWREQKGKRVELVYNHETELTAVINEHGERYVLERDANGSIIRETGFDGMVKQYERSPSGLLRKVERPGGRWTTFEYDEMGRVIHSAYSDGLVESYHYNRVGDLLESFNPFTTVKLEYDSAGRVTKEWLDGYWVASQYDENSNRTQVSSSLGEHLTFERDLLGQVTQMQAERKGKRQGQQTQQTKGDFGGSSPASSPEDGAGTLWSAQMKYNALGQEIERLLPGGVISQWQYDVAGRPEQHSVKTGGREHHKIKYEWDVNNRLKLITNGLTGKRTLFNHDDFGTLIGATDQYGKIFRMSDDVGNLYSTGHRTDRKYGLGGRLLEFEGTKYSYDEEGNLIEKLDPDGTRWRYAYYGNGMMSKVVRPDGKEVIFTYDSLGRRIEKHFDGVVHCYVWDGNTILHEWEAESGFAGESKELGDGDSEIGQSQAIFGKSGQESDPASLITWVFEDGTFHPAAKITSEGHYSIVTDHLGTPVKMYDEHGEQVWSCELDIYGNVRKFILKGDHNACPFRYPGQYEDVETGLYYNRFRYYSPHEGMYTQQDPIGLAGGIRLYGYVDDPIIWVDVFGLKKNGGSKGSDSTEQCRGGGTGKLERSEHAVLRSKEGRPVGSAINDVQKARQSNVLVQGDGRWVIKGDNSRIHIVEADGSQVITSFKNPSKNTNMRIQDGRWIRPSEAELQQFKEIFSDYVRW